MPQRTTVHLTPRPQRAGDIEITFQTPEEEIVVTLSPESAMELVKAMQEALRADGRLPQPGAAN